MSIYTEPTPLRMRFSSPSDRLRVLLLTNDETSEPTGQHVTATPLDENEFQALPGGFAKPKGEPGALREILEIVRTNRPNVIVQTTPSGFPFTEDWFRAVVAGPSSPILLYWEGDAWSRWSKPVWRGWRGRATSP